MRKMLKMITRLSLIYVLTSFAAAAAGSNGTIPLCAKAGPEHQPADAPKPNIVLILADDLGSGHVGWQNPKVKTPHMGRLANAGVKLNRHYVAPVYSPTRVALLTRRYWSRFDCNEPLPSELDSTVDRLGQRDNTLIICLSDNGAPGQPNRMQVKQDLESYPDVRLPSDNLPFRGKKGDVYEGGIRTPGVVCWPGKLQPGVCDIPLSVTDWMPTLCELAGGKPPRDLKLDGHDIFPVLTGITAHPSSRILYCKGPDHASVVSDDSWKLIVTGKTVALYNLTKDIGEKADLAGQNPDLVRQLHAKLETQSAKDNDAVPNQTVSP